MVSPGNFDISCDLECIVWKMAYHYKTVYIPVGIIAVGWLSCHVKYYLLWITCATFKLFLKSPFCAPFVFSLTYLITFLPTSSVKFIISLIHFLQFPYLFAAFQYFSACTIDYEQETQTCKGSTPLYPLECNQMTKDREWSVKRNKQCSVHSAERL